MAEKEFVVSHRRARTPLIVRGKNLEEALKKEGLDPKIWKEVSPAGQQESPLEGRANSKPKPD